VRVLVFHGYLLRGTGSNVYNASLAQALAKLGHDVHLLCQDHDAGTLPWVDRVGRWQGGKLKVEDTPSPGAPEREGSVTTYLPDIGGLLPVYVADRYERFSVKTFPELSENELDRYLDANVAAVTDVVELTGGVDAALANHLVMSPAILARSGLEFAAKIHGSDLSYTVMPHRERFVPFAHEGLAEARGVLVGSRHTAKDLWRTLEDSDLPLRTRLGPPGVDVELFRRRPPAEATKELRSLAREIRTAGADPDFGSDAPGAAAALEWWGEGSGPRVVFVGKLIVSKGIDLLVATWPLVIRANPDARLLVVGFGKYRDSVERLLAALADGDLTAVREIAARGRGLEGGPEGRLRILESFLASQPDSYADAARAAAGSVALPGRLEHGEVARLLPAADAMVVPSTFPEAFGMVAAEAAACGALPVCAGHSGLAEVARALSDSLPNEARGLVSFPIDDRAVEGIADRLNGWLALPPAVRERSEAALADTVRELWSWERVADAVIAASGGRLDGLPAVPDE
jgi:glycosyltransferase involved in cell wall biosynthesis